MMNFIKEAIKLGLVMFAGQLVFEGLNHALKHAKTCGKGNCCHHSHDITEKKEEKKTTKKKTK